MGFQTTDHQAIQNAQRPKANDAGSFSEAAAFMLHEVNDAATHVTLHASLPEFKGTQPGVHEDGLNFHEADAAMGEGGLFASGAGLYASVMKQNPAQKAGIEAADAKLDQWLQAA